MNAQLQRNLIDARHHLRETQAWLHFQRRLGCPADFPDIWQATLKRFYTALDRAWDAQCMAQANL